MKGLSETAVARLALRNLGRPRGLYSRCFLKLFAKQLRLAGPYSCIVSIGLGDKHSGLDLLDTQISSFQDLKRLVELEPNMASIQHDQIGTHEIFQIIKSA
jgi:hypothetical protein